LSWSAQLLREARADGGPSPPTCRPWRC